jgi:ferredoxin
VAAGLGRMGIHRNVIHPRFGNFILLATVLIDAEVTEQDRPLDYNPCLGCKLCVAACPVGAIAPDGHFDFSACLTHNYREFLGGFVDWVEQVADSEDAEDYRRRVNDSETASMWQSLGFGPQYKAAYCMAACPAGDDVIGPFLADRGGFVGGVVEPLRAKEEPVYVIPGSDAEAYVTRRFPHKRPRRVGGGRRPRSIRSFLFALPHLFQRHASAGLDAVYHFTFTGEEPAEATVVIRGETIRVEPGHAGRPDLHVRADGRTWLGFLAGERSLAWALLRRKIRLKGSPRLLPAFGRCFPS